jgi:hypothetical protein
MAAIVGFVVEQDFTEPAIANIIVTAKGVVIARTDGEASALHIIGTYPDLLRNWMALLAAAGLSASELVDAQLLFATKVGFFGEANA